MTPMAEPRRWFDPSQPQTLQGAVMLSYLTAALSLLWILFGAYPLVISLGLGAAGYGVANERRWGYWLGIVLAGLSVAGLLLRPVRSRVRRASLHQPGLHGRARAPCSSIPRAASTSASGSSDAAGRDARRPARIVSGHDDDRFEHRRAQQARRASTSGAPTGT